MKKLLFLLLPILSYCQDIKIVKDDFTSIKKIQVTTQKQNALLPGSIAKGITMTLTCYANISSSGEKFMYLSANMAIGSIQCFSNLDGKIVFLFEDGTTLTLKQISKLKCDTNAIVMYELPETSMVTFLNNDIKKIRVYSTDVYLDGEIKEGKKQLIKDTFIAYQNALN